MSESIHGTFHFHSTYSHDGLSTLPEIARALQGRGLAFCVMTEHFEDFDAEKYEKYLNELKAVSAETGFAFLPGIEIHLSGLDTVVFPVPEGRAGFEALTRLDREGIDSDPAMFKVLVHPSKYQFADVTRHLARYRIQGVELWNQQVDGSHLPPIDFLAALAPEAAKNSSLYFFGCDLHSAKLTVANVLTLPASVDRTPQAISVALREGSFVARNLPTGIEYANASASSFDAWLAAVRGRSYTRGRMLRKVRRWLRSLYRMLPRDSQRALNDFKNFVRNKV